MPDVMIRAIFFDIDGTLLSSRCHSMLPSTAEAITALRRNGVRCFISSGRPMVLIPSFPVGFDGYITVNGGFCFVGDKVVLRNPINADDCRRWLLYVEENDLTTMCFTEHKMYINRIDKPTLALREQLGFDMPPIAPLSEMAEEDVFQFIAMQPADKDAAALEALSHCRMPRWHPVFTDLIPDDSSKAVGIERIIGHFGIGREETMAFGDGHNDIEMLDYVGIGVAMGNAATEVKRHAQHVTDDADHDGIYNALRELKVL